MAWAKTNRTIPWNEWKIIKDNVLARDNYRCKVCGRRAIEVDHVVCKAEGGTDQMNNLQALCRNHHKEKTLKEASRGRQRYHRSRVRDDSTYQGPKRKI